MLQNAEFGASTVLKVQELNGAMKLTEEFGLINSKFIDFKVAVTEQTVLVVLTGQATDTYHLIPVATDLFNMLYSQVALAPPLKDITSTCTTAIELGSQLVKAIASAIDKGQCRVKKNEWEDLKHKIIVPKAVAEQLTGSSICVRIPFSVWDVGSRSWVFAQWMDALFAVSVGLCRVHLATDTHPWPEYRPCFRLIA